jgi:hypothetical protein
VQLLSIVSERALGFGSVELLEGEGRFLLVERLDPHRLALAAHA